MSLYAEYLKEREDKHVIENDFGFATYSINKEEIYLQDIYIKPEYRLQGMGKDFLRYVENEGLSHGCKFITGSVDTKLKSCTDSAKAILSCGFKVAGLRGDLIIFYKEL